MVIGKILGMAGKALAKKFLSKKLGKKGMSTFIKRKATISTISGRPKIGTFVSAFQRVPEFGGPIKKAKKKLKKD